jgi:hypothetical protein
LFDAPQIFPDFVVVGPLTDQTAYGLVMAHFEPLCDPFVARGGARPQQGRQRHLARITFPGGQQLSLLIA